ADDDSGKGGAKTPMNSLANANLVPIVAQLFALILLFIFFRGVRFGTPREPRTISRRAFSDHARALGMNYARAKAVEHSNGLFAAWALDRLRERLQGTSRRGIAPLAEAIAQRTGEPIGAVTTTLLDATGARDEVAPPSSYRGGASSPPPAHSPSRRADFSIMNELDRFLSATKTKKRTERP
ncbi:MAG: hypothetical protein U0271_39730, partial [Polyangiaceae bacterium]